MNPRPPRKQRHCKDCGLAIQPWTYLCFRCIAREQHETAVDEAAE